MEIYNNVHFVGEFNGFNYVANAAVAANAAIKTGNLIGVTRRSFAIGETVQAFLSRPASVYNFELAAAAEAAATQGTTVYITSAGKLTTTATNNTEIGCLWQPIAVGDTYAAVVLKSY